MYRIRLLRRASGDKTAVDSCQDPPVGSCVGQSLQGKLMVTLLAA